MENHGIKRYAPQQTEEIAQAFLEGKVLAFPTDTVYGVGCLYGNQQAFSRLKQAKHRPEEKPIPMMAASMEQAEHAVMADARSRKIAEALLPGALTLILPVQPELDRIFTNGKDTAALRIPDTPWLLSVMEKTGMPLMVSSANISGQPAALCAEDAVEMLPGIDGIIEGECGCRQASTIVDCTAKELKILRSGPVSMETIQKCFSKG